MKWPRRALLGGAILLMAGCGQKGALYMQPAAPSAAAAASAPAR